MEISARWLDGAHVLALAGSPTPDSGQHLREALRAALDEGRTRFVMDLRELDSVDSMTLGELVGCVKRTRERRGDIRLVVLPGGIVHELLQLAGLDRVFRIFGDEREAAASYGTGGSS